MRGIKADIVRTEKPLPKPPEVKKAAAPKPKKAAAPKPTPPKKVEAAPPAEPVRARNDEGHYVKDDPSTPEVNEAFEGGKPLAKAWDKKDKKADLLTVAENGGLGGLSMDNTKAEIIAALEEAGL
jgi:hypothetical protein